MLWILLAILAHAGNGVVFIVDKGLLATDSRVGDPVRLAFYSGLVSAAAAVLLFLDFVPPNMDVLLWSTVAGACFVAALVLFFRALAEGESSRVVPLAGSAVPVFTLVLAALFLGEQLPARHLLAVFVLIVGGAMLSLRLWGYGLSFPAARAAVASGAFFAAYFATVKHVYDIFPSFWSAFAYSRVMAAVAALVLLGPVMLWRPKQAATGRRPVYRTRSIVGAFLGSKVLGTAAFIVQNYAISLGSVTVVNALQGTQYVFVLLLAAVVSRIAPRLFSEELSRVALAQKVVGILLVAVGLVLLV